MLERKVTQIVEDSLAHMRVTVLTGARQVGKTTLVQQIAARRPDSTFVTLDDEVSRQAARDDPVGFVARLSPLTVIDEIQRAPDMLLAIKQRVDRNTGPGQFLLTGSSNLMLSGAIPDALPGRAAYVNLYPFSQAEIAGKAPSFVGSLFAGEMPEAQTAEVGITPYLERIVAGGYPEARTLPPGQRERFFAGYTQTVLARDVEDVARVESRETLARVLRLVAARSGTPLNTAAIGRETGIDIKTARRYVGILENLFLVTRLPAWSRNVVKRQTKMPKAVVSDTGLLAHLVNASAARLGDIASSKLLGAFFETFGVNELVKLCSIESSAISHFHYRDRDHREIDLLLERNDGSLVGIEFKASASVRPSDFKHLDFLRGKVGSQLQASCVVYTGERSVQFAPGKFAVPLCALWT